MFDLALRALEAERLALQDGLKAIERAIAALNGKPATKKKGGGRVHDKVLTLLMAHPGGLTVPEIAKQVGASRQGVREIIKRLDAKAGGNPKRKVYRLQEKPVRSKAAVQRERGSLTAAMRRLLAENPKGLVWSELRAKFPDRPEGSVRNAIGYAGGKAYGKKPKTYRLIKESKHARPEKVNNEQAAAA